MNTHRALNYKLYMQKEEGFTRTSFQGEFEKYKAIQSGNIDAVKENIKKVHSDFYKGKGVLSEDPVRNIRYHMIISTAIIARICVEGGMAHNEAYSLSDIYIQKADVCNSYDGILNLLEKMHIDFATRMRNMKKESVISIHVRKSIDYIYDHIDEKLSVSTIANYVQRDPSYLSRLFLSETGSSIHNFVINARIDTAKNMLVYSDFTYSDIASTLGFSSQSAFISVFKKRTGHTPKQYRNMYYKHELK